MSAANILQQVSDYYRKCLERYGPTPRGVDWNTLESQILRFEQLSKLLPTEKETPFSVLDYGCGYGALVGFIQSRYTAVQYTGFDCVDAMLASADLNYGGIPHVRFAAELPPVGRYDYVLASGVFNVKQGVDERDWERYVLETIEQLFSRCERGFAFNALTRYADPEKMRDDLYYANPLRLFEYCRTRFSRRVALLHDYPLYEFTIVVRRDEP